MRFCIWKSQRDCGKAEKNNVGCILHETLFIGTKFPFIMKLCFSSSRSMTIRNGDNNSNGAGEKRTDQEH